MESNKYSDSVWKMKGCLEEVTYSKNVPFKIIRLYFLKYVIDNNIGARTKQDLIYDMQVLKIFAKRYTEGGPNALVPVLFRIDDMYNLHGIINRTIDEYAKDLFALNDSWARRNASEAQLKKLMGEVAALDLSGGDDESETFAVGKEIVANLLPIVYDISKSYARQVGEFTTLTQVSELASQILNVKDGETFCDFASGIGASTIKIVGNADAKIYNTEINEEIAAVAAMLYIMSGYKDINITVADGLIEKNLDCKANRIFVDPPLRFSVESKFVDGGNVAIERAIDCLDNEGMAIITAPNTTLFRNSNREIAQRKNLFENGYINSVITLPPCWSGTGLNTNLIVLTKTRNKNILFIDASTNKYFKFYERERGNYLLTNDGVQLIIKFFVDRADFTGVAKVVNTLDDNFNLQPAAYIDTPLFDGEENCSVEEIDLELKELYAQFAKLTGEN